MGSNPALAIIYIHTPSRTKFAVSSKNRDYFLVPGAKAQVIYVTDFVIIVANNGGERKYEAKAKYRRHEPLMTCSRDKPLRGNGESGCWLLGERIGEEEEDEQKERRRRRSRYGKGVEKEHIWRRRGEGADMKKERRRSKYGEGEGKNRYGEGGKNRNLSIRHLP